MNSGDTHCAEAITDSFTLKSSERTKAEEPLKGDEVKIEYLSKMLPLEGDQKVKLEPKKTVVKE